MQARRILGTTLLVAALWIRLAPAQEPRSEVTTAGSVAAYVEADLNAEREGVYGSYAAGVFLRSAGRRPMRLRGRVGGRIINVVAPLAYADLGLGGELFVARTLALGLDLARPFRWAMAAATRVRTESRFLPRAVRSG
jgi:hypothetical protein